MSRCRKVLVIAPSSPVGEFELARGVSRLRDAGLDVDVHPDAHRRHFLNAGDDETRAGALLEAAGRDDVEVIWCARGGYGATRILPLLERAQRPAGAAKLLVGYSDITALHEFVRNRWGWYTLHANVPAADSFVRMSQLEWDATLGLVNRIRPELGVEQARLQRVSGSHQTPVRGELVGGNLTLWAALAGTPWQPSAEGRILFFEDIGEAWYRIDRMVNQMGQSGMFDGLAALVLGDFTDCDDETHLVRDIRSADPDARVPLRARIEPEQALREIFGPWGERLGFAVFGGLPVGHGKNQHPLPLGAWYEITPDQRLAMGDWAWLTVPEG